MTLESSFGYNAADVLARAEEAGIKMTADQAQVVLEQIAGSIDQACCAAATEVIDRALEGAE